MRATKFASMRCVRVRAAAQRRFIEASPLADAYGRMITPEEVAEAILYLASDAAAMVTGTALRIDGGKSLGVPPSRPFFPAADPPLSR